MREDRASVKRVSDELEWFRSFDLDVEISAFQVLESRMNALGIGIGQLEASVAGISKVIDELRPQSALGWDPRRWFSTDRRRYARAVSSERTKLKGERKRLRAAQKHAVSLQGLMDAQHSNIERYRRFDQLASQRAYRELESKIADEEAKLAVLHVRRDELDKDLAEPVRELGECASKVRRLRKSVQAAENLLSRLNRASDSYERAMVHKDCESQFGTGKPHQALADCRSRLAKAEGDYDRVLKRCHDIVESAVIDFPPISATWPS